MVNRRKCRRDDFSNYIAEHQAFLAPMHRLPAELLSQIFSRYCDNINAYSSENPFSSDNSSSFRKHPFTLAKVCRRWRAIVLSTPQIWSQFRVKFNERNIKRCATMTQAWFSKSGACPLSLGFEGHDYGYLRTQDIRPMLDAIKPYCDRIETLNLGVCFPTFSAFMSNAGTFPALHSIKISILGMNGGPDPPHIWRALENAPTQSSLS